MWLEGKPEKASIFAGVLWDSRPYFVRGVIYLSSCPLWRLNSLALTSCRLERQQKTAEQDGSATQPQLQAKDLTASLDSISTHTCSRKAEGTEGRLSTPDLVPWPTGGWWAMFRLGLLHVLLTSGNALRHTRSGFTLFPDASQTCQTDHKGKSWGGY